MAKIFTITVLVAIFFCSMFAFNAAAKNTERAECKRWAQQAKELPNFFYSSWQREQCGLK